jgi:phosphate-selective porin OprO and OprP
MALCHADQPAPPDPSAEPQPGSSGPAPGASAPAIDESNDAAQADGDTPRRRLVKWNEYEGPYFTFRFGGGLLYDGAGFEQDAASLEQLQLSRASGLRDFRLLGKGKVKFVPGLSYTIGYMYDGAAKQWVFRQTGLMLDVPQLWGDIFIGRQKEGFSTNKIMVGYQGWTIERSTASDSFIPILADGIKWTGRIPDGKLVYNVSFFRDDWSETESFNRNDNQAVGRVVWLPFAGEDTDTLLHLAVEARYGQSDDGYLRFRSKPESFLAQEYVIDTGKFPASHTNMTGVEAYYRPGPLMFGMEYYFNQVASREEQNPFFHGGEIFAAYLLTGEIRPYNARGAYFDRISPNRPLFSGGPGAWELVLRFSYTDLDSGPVQGGKFWRLTPMMNWYMSDNVRLEFSYGYGVLNRDNLQGGIQFFQARIQFQL